jgi:hypothetical protein
MLASQVEMATRKPQVAGSQARTSACPYQFLRPALTGLARFGIYPAASQVSDPSELLFGDAGR